MDERHDVIVIGLGAMGSAACLELARRGRRVLGLERHGIPHAQGSSAGESRVIRLCYYEHPDYVPLLRRAYELWDDLSEAAGEPLLHRTGGLYAGAEDGSFIQGNLRAAAAHDLPIEQLGAADLRRRYPVFQLPGDHVGVWEPDAGFLRPERIISVSAELAMQRGADLRGREASLDWEAHEEGVTVRTDRATYEADHLVLCAGAWSGRLLAELGVELVVTRQVLAWVQPRRPELFAPGAFPVWGVDDPDGHFYYGFPMDPRGRPGLKIARHFEGRPTDPESIDRTPTPADEDEVRPILEHLLPDARGPFLSMAICMYTNSPDGHFIIDHHPRHERVTIACGFSGHGFKFATVVGEILADLAIDGTTSHPIDFLRLDRLLGRGRISVEQA
ncbi:MAG: N-methyl-L-tryptophan oxidase [Planctomycetota bacterium]|jgi:sarcosine oxidase